MQRATSTLLPLLAVGALVLAAGAAVAKEATLAAKETGCSDGRVLCFDQDALTAQGGEEVTLTFRNEGTQPHSLCVDGLPEGEVCTPNAKTGSPPGTSETVTFTAPGEGGMLTYYCAVAGHRDLGMEGNISVTPGTTTGTEDKGTPGPGALEVGLLAAAGALALGMRRRRTA